MAEPWQTFILEGRRGENPGWERARERLGVSKVHRVLRRGAHHCAWKRVQIWESDKGHPGMTCWEV